MPAANGASTWSDQVGPIRGDVVQCEHGGPTLPSDPGIEHVRRCQSRAVFRAPWPTAGVLGVRAVCPFHLGRLLEDLDDADQARLEADHGARELLSPDDFLRLADVPTEFEVAGSRYYRVGLDQDGDAHLYRPRADRVVVLDGRFEPVDAENLSAHSFGEWLAFVRDRRGWAAFDDRVVLDPDGPCRWASTEGSP